MRPSSATPARGSTRSCSCWNLSCASLVGFADDDEHAGHDLELVGLASVLREPTFEIRIERLRCRQRWLRGERHIGCLRSERLACFRAAGLHDDRPALRARRDVERAFHTKVRAAMVEAMHAARIEVATARLVGEDPRLLPKSPTGP